MTLDRPSPNPTLPSTNDLLPAIQSNQPTTLAYILEALPSTTLTNDIIQAAVSTASIPIFTLLLGYDSSIINREFEDGNTPLMIACQGRNPNFVIWLLDRDADPKLGGEEGKGPLWQAVRTRQGEGLIGRLLEEGVGVDERVKQMAIAVGDLRVLDLLGVRWH